MSLPAVLPPTSHAAAPLHYSFSRCFLIQSNLQYILQGQSSWSMQRLNALLRQNGSSSNFRSLKLWLLGFQILNHKVLHCKKRGRRK